MAGLVHRVRQLEQAAANRGLCPVCGATDKVVSRIILIGEGDPEPEATPCPACGWEPEVVLTRVYRGVDLSRV